MVSLKMEKKQLQTIITILRPYLTLATFYILTDALYDWGLLKVPYPFGDILYFGRYSLVLLCYAAKLIRIQYAKRKLTTSLQINGKGGERGEQ